ncbi:MAG: molybdopterin-dependent oxidoreductase [Myxococcales bacterium]|jgi:DMSO/TMAO reductase YedYZ molybdopterin-dependent catalytic subunit
MSSRKPTLLAGALVGAMLSLCTAAVLYAASQLSSLPFPPFDLFDAAARLLPGAVIAAGIDAMVQLTARLDLGPTARVAKTMERATGLIAFVTAGAVAGALLLVWLRRRGLRSPRIAGAGLGLVAGSIASAAAAVAGSATALVATWDLMTGVGWGVCTELAVRRLCRSATGPRGERGASRTRGVGARAAGHRDVGHALAGGTPAPPRDQGDRFIERIDRRRFLLRLGGATAVISVTGAAVGELASGRTAAGGSNAARNRRPWSATHALPNAAARVRPAPGTRAELTPVPQHYRIDIDTRPPDVTRADYRLDIGGLVRTPRSFSLAALEQEFSALHQFVTLSCISNPVGGDLIGTTRWTGASLQDVLARVEPAAGATHVRIRALDGFDEVVALETARNDRRVMLAYAWDGLPLTAEHGFPLRVYVPGVYGMKQPKWIESLELVDGWQPGYWVRRGWDRHARMKTTSVIDTVAVDAAYRNEAGRLLVPIGGIAHAGARGISRVELRQDDGPWQGAQLRTPLSSTTWVIWRLDWPFEAGEHTFSVRCVDGTGAPQAVQSSPPEPSGATGLDRRTARL